MQGLLGRACVHQDNTITAYLHEKKRKKTLLQIVWKPCLLVLWEDQHPEDFHLESQQAQTKSLRAWGHRDLTAEEKRLSGVQIVAIRTSSDLITHNLLKTIITAPQKVTGHRNNSVERLRQKNQRNGATDANLWFTWPANIDSFYISNNHPYLNIVGHSLTHT